MFDDKRLRDRVRCFFKTLIQNAKKRLHTMLRNPNKRRNRDALRGLICSHNGEKEENGVVALALAGENGFGGCGQEGGGALVGRRPMPQSSSSSPIMPMTQPIRQKFKLRTGGPSNTTMTELMASVVVSSSPPAFSPLPAAVTSLDSDDDGSDDAEEEDESLEEMAIAEGLVCDEMLTCGEDLMCCEEY